MIIKTKLTERDFINASFVVTYQKPMTKIKIGVILLIGLYLTAALPARDTWLSIGIPGLILAIVQPAFQYLAFKSAYHTVPSARESTAYDIDQVRLLVKGEAKESKFSWDRVVKVTETRNWLLIWCNDITAYGIPIRDVQDAQMNELKLILEERGVKNNLR